MAFHVAFGLNIIEWIVSAIVLIQMILANLAASLASLFASKCLSFNLWSSLEFLALKRRLL